MHLLLVRLTCAVIALYHLLVGLTATVAPAAALTLAGPLYGVSFETFGAMRPEYALVVRFIGAFAIAFGVMMAWAAAAPVRSKGILLGALVFFAVRILDRIIGATLLINSLHTTAARNYTQMAIMVLFVVVLAIGLTRSRTQ